MPTLREFLNAGGVVLVGVAIPGAARIAVLYTPSATQIVEIYMKSDPQGSEVWFDPIGVHVESGQTVRWTVMENVHTTTAYHPKNEMHALRIPKGATPAFYNRRPCPTTTMSRPRLCDRDPALVASPYLNCLTFWG